MKTHANSRLFKFLLIFLLITALAALAVACIQAPVEQRAITNKLIASHPVNTSATSAEEQLEPNGTDEDEPVISDEDEPEDTDLNDHQTENNDPDPDPDENSNDENEGRVRSDRSDETTLSIELEGMTEAIPANLFVSQLGYSLYYGTAGYQVRTSLKNVETGYQTDEIWPAEPVSELPDMFIRIYHISDLNPAEAADYMKSLVNERFADVSELEETVFAAAQYEANTFTAQNGSDWDSAFVTITILSDGLDGAYAVVSQYFSGAAEGYGSRFAQMLATFEIES